MPNWEITCEVDGYWTDLYSREHYWHCEEPGVDEIDGVRMCLRHAADHRRDNA